MINLPAGEELQDHQVHERAWILVVDGEVEIEAAGETVERRTGLARADGPERAPRGARDHRCAPGAGPRARGRATATRPSGERSRRPGMRALLYDIHGNLPALEAVIADARAAGADEFVLGGDYALAGAWPAGEREAAREARAATGSAGNTDRWLEDPPTRPTTSCCTGDRVLPRRARRQAHRASCSSCPTTDQIDGALRVPCVAAQRHAHLHAGAHRRRPRAARQQRGEGRDLRPQPHPVLARGGGRHAARQPRAASGSRSTATGAPPTRSGTAGASSSCGASSTTPTATPSRSATAWASARRHGRDARAADPAGRPGRLTGAFRLGTIRPWPPPTDPPPAPPAS